MHYNKKIFRNHYGHIWWALMYWSLCFAFLFLQLAYYPQLFGWNPPAGLVGSMATLCMICLVIGVPIGGFMYFDCRRIARQQQQWIDKKKIYYRTTHRKLVSLRRPVEHTLTYHVRRLNKMEITRRFIVCTGDISVTDETPNSTRTYTTRELKIPRCFTNEERITKLMKNF